MNEEKIIKQIKEIYKKYGNCKHLLYPAGIPAPNHCIELFEKSLQREIDRENDMFKNLV